MLKIKSNSDTFFKEALKLGIKDKEALKLGIKDLGDIDNLIDVRTKTLLLKYIHDDNHFLKDFLENTEAHGADILLYTPGSTQAK